MGKYWQHYASYSIWSQTSPAIGKEYWHCDRKRGYIRARKKEPAIKELLEKDNIPQRIGILAQRGVYEFHHHVELLSQSDGVKKVAAILELEKESNEVRYRVEFILYNYHQEPFLVGKEILELKRGDESFPEPIEIKLGNSSFALFAAFDCVFREPEDNTNTIHVLDFKTGKSDFDRRQAYVYLVAGQHLYPNKNAIVSFYNLETKVLSEPISLSAIAIESIEIELSLVAQKLQQDRKRYKSNPELFDRIFPANPGFQCDYCPFKSICEYARQN